MRRVIVVFLLALVAALVVPGWGISVTLLAIIAVGGAGVGWAVWRQRVGTPA